MIGMTAIVDETDKVKGIFTEGDLRRLIERVGDIRPLKIRDVMTPNPTTIQPQALAAEAAKSSQQHFKEPAAGCRRQRSADRCAPHPRPYDRKGNLMKAEAIAKKS